MCLCVVCILCVCGIFVLSAVLCVVRYECVACCLCVCVCVCVFVSMFCACYAYIMGVRCVYVCVCARCCVFSSNNTPSRFRAAHASNLRADQGSFRNQSFIMELDDDIPSGLRNQPPKVSGYPCVRLGIIPQGDSSSLCGLTTAHTPG